jgi:P27 family predicted phage terminase small subunit
VKLAEQAQAEQELASLGLPSVPPRVNLGPLGMHLWRQWTEELHRQNRLAFVDAASIAAAAGAYELAMEARAQVKKHGVTLSIKGDKGQSRFIPNPALIAMNDCLRLAKQFMTEHGLTEASRSRLQRVDLRQEDNLADVIASRQVDFGGLDVSKLQ